MIKGNFEQIKLFGMCDEALAAHQKFMLDNNLTEMTFDQAVEVDKNSGKLEWLVYAYEYKPELAKLCRYTIPPEEAAADAALLAELKTGVFTGKYQFMGQEYDNIELAKNAKQQFLAEETVRIEPLIKFNLVTTQDGHETWSVIDDLNDPAIPVGPEYSYGVFNPRTGTYVFGSTIEEAKIKKQEVIQDNLNSTPSPIFAINKHPWFPNSPILFPVQE